MKQNFFFQNIKSALRFVLIRTGLWRFVVESNFYQKRNYPEQYKKQEEEINFYKTLFKGSNAGNDLIFDVGANIGDKSMVFLKLSKCVIAFEPSIKLYNYLQNRFKQKNLKIFNCALGSTVSFSDFYVVENYEAYNSLNKKHIETTATKRGIATTDTVKVEKIKVEVLENFINKFGIPRYIKIDVEGYENEVIKGLKTPVPFLSFEVNLPEFLNESILSIQYLDNISSKNYSYNFTINNKFLYDEFLPKGEAVDFLENTDLQYLEVYASLSKN